MDEGNTPFSAASATAFGGADGQSGLDDDDGGESQLKHAVNGQLLFEPSCVLASIGQWHLLPNPALPRAGCSYIRELPDI